MSSYLPYIIVAGIVVIFFIICLIMFSGTKTEKEHKKQEAAAQQNLARKRAEEKAAWAQLEAQNDEREAKRKQAAHSQTAPVSRISTVTVRERRENPQETAFVTTKGEAVRRNGQIVYEEAPKKDKKKKDDFDATRVLSRDEIIEAMDKVDKEEAAAYKAEAEEAKKKREAESMREAAKEEQERRLVEETARQQQEAAAKARQAAARPQLKPADNEEETSLADMAAVVSQDLAEKGQAGKPVATAAAVRPGNAAKKKVAAADTALEETRVVQPVAAEKKAALGEETRRMEPLHIDTAAEQDEATAQIPPVRQPSRRQAKKSTAPRTSPWGNDLSKTGARASERTSIWSSDLATDSNVVRDCTYHFLGQYGVTTEKFQQDVRNITAAAFNRIGCRTDAEREKAVTPLLVQEALQNVQKTYASHPEDYVATMALRAFYDIVYCSPASTRYLVAIDALKVMPYLNRSHYQILAILLLFLYSRNSHNVDKTTFCQYIDKYVMPFLDHFPTERPYYQQLDYLHCTALETKETHFSEILADSYPLLFRYRGFTEEELRKALKGQRIPREYVVRSFNSPLIKLALVDESMAPRFFRATGIADREMQDRLMRLAQKRPADFSGEEALDIMEDISPILADLGDIWDSTLLRISTLSLLGLYLAQGFVKEAIGEEFDLSRWFE